MAEFPICAQSIYSAPLTYATLFLYGYVVSYLNALAEQKSHENEINAQRGWQSAIPFAVLFLEYISLSFVLYLSSGGVLAIGVFIRF